jgi:hypothetical protein
LGVFLAIKISYATIPKRNVIESTASATRDLPAINHRRPKDIKIVYIFQSFSHGRKPTLFSLMGQAHALPNNLGPASDAFAIQG